MVKKNSEFCYYHAKEGVTRRNRNRKGRENYTDRLFFTLSFDKKKTTTENVLTDPLPKSISDFQDQLDPGE